MTLRELLKINRSYRRFYQDEKISIDILREMVENVRFCGSAANIQPLKFFLVNDETVTAKIFPCLKWAGYLNDWPGPEEGERPAAYIVMTGQRDKSPFIDADYGIALQTILLTAVEKGLGGCAIAALDRDTVRNILDIPKELDFPMIIALGKPKEKVVIDTITDDNIKYWRDENQVHHVPKKDLSQLILKEI